MTERQLQFRVGIFVVMALSVAAAMVFYFGQFRSFWMERYSVAIHFDEAPGLYPESPVQMNGVTIGKVRDLVFDEKRGGVTVLVDIRAQYRLQTDSQVRLVRSLLGDAAIEFTPGNSGQPLPPGTLLDGELPPDPMKIVSNLDRRMTETMESFESTSREWRRLAENLNGVMQTNRGNINTVVERTATALTKFSQTMETAHQTLAGANSMLADPEYQQNIRETLRLMPHLAKQTQETIVAVRQTVSTLNQNLENLQGVTEPLSQKSVSIVTKLDATLTNVQTLSAELNRFTQLAAREDGTLHQFATDPNLYRNLNRSAASLTVLLKNLEPVTKDLRIFSDRIARHPELMGVGGALRPTSGVKRE